jgi:hypothetical protein
MGFSQTTEIKQTAAALRMSAPHPRAAILAVSIRKAEARVDRPTDNPCRFEEAAAHSPASWAAGPLACKCSTSYTAPSLAWANRARQSA